MGVMALCLTSNFFIKCLKLVSVHYPFQKVKYIEIRTQLYDHNISDQVRFRVKSTKYYGSYGPFQCHCLQNA